MEESVKTPPSHEELAKKVKELEGRLTQANELMGKIREHKHNYSEDFGLVVSAPAQALLAEMIANPEVFTLEEKDTIVKLFAISMEMRGTYECLGWPIDNQLDRVKNFMIPQIRKNADFFTSMVSKPVEYRDRWIVSKLRMALSETDSLCNKLETIETFDYGESEPFSLKDVIRDTFNKDNIAVCSQGGIPIQLETFYGEYPEVMVEMDYKGFCSYFLGNIIKNLHDHAFKDIDDLLNSSIKDETKKSLWRKIKIWFRHIRNDRFADMPNTPLPEKKVRILFKRDEQDSQRIILVIENNGKTFDGDTESVFDNGVGSGSGIGLYSAKRFLNAYHATIEMYTNMESEFKVGFIINLPIL